MLIGPRATNYSERSFNTNKYVSSNHIASIETLSDSLSMKYCLVADIAGFSNIMENLNESERTERVQKWVGLVVDCARENGIDSDTWQLVSDTVFVGAPSTPAGLRSLVNFSRQLIEQGIDESLPIRGGIAIGEVTMEDPISYGPGIVRAHRLCELQKWIGIACDHDLPDVDTMWSRTDGLIAYPIPLKDGNISVYPAVAWDIPPASKLTKLLTSNGLVRDGQVIQWHLGELWQNTILFSLYMRLLPNGAPSNEFRGYFPTDLITKMLDLE